MILKVTENQYSRLS